METYILLILLFYGRGCRGEVLQQCRLHFWPQLNTKVGLNQTYSKSSIPMQSTREFPVMMVGEIMRFSVNCTCCDRLEEMVLAKKQLGLIFIRVFSQNRNAIMPSRWPGVDASVRALYDNAGDMSIGHAECYGEPKCSIIYLTVTSNQMFQFWVETNTAGRGDIRVDLVWMNASKDELPRDVPCLTTKFTKRFGSARRPIPVTIAKQFTTLLLTRGEVLNASGVNASRVTVLLKPVIFQTVFDGAVLAIASLIAVSVGCVTDRTSFRVCIKRPMTIMVGLLLQIFVIPLLALGVGFACNLPIEMIYGLFVTATIQVGGAAFVVVSISECDSQLAAAISQITTLFNVVTAPVLIYTVGRFAFNQTIFMFRLIGLLLLVFIIQFVGVFIRWSRPTAAKAFLTWFSQPLLLLSGILLITLGVYINQYAFQHVNQQIIIALGFMVTISYTLGWLMGLSLRQGMKRCKVFAAHASTFQGCLAIPVLRICVPSPEGELASTIALWTIFMMPVPLVYNLVIKVGYETVKSLHTSYKHKRAKKGPTAVLCTDSLATVAATAILLNVSTNATIGQQDNTSMYTVRSADGIIRIGSEKREEKPHARSLIGFKEGMSNVDRAAFLESICEVRRGKKGELNDARKPKKRAGGPGRIQEEAGRSQIPQKHHRHP